MSYKVKLDIFEGPFDLLVYLVENAKMSLYDIKVSEITNQYLEYIKEMNRKDLVLGGEFINLAAMLIQLKSKMLLPRHQDEDKLLEDDPRNELVQKLLEYKKFKAIAEHLREQEAIGKYIFEKEREDTAPYINEEDEYLNMNIPAFMEAFKKFLMKKSRVEKVKGLYQRVEREKESQASKIKYINNLFKTNKGELLKFQDLLVEDNSYQVVLTFTSLLEMMKRRHLYVKQRENFGEIIIDTYKNKEL